ncbi:MAG: phosphohydrolase, partial [Acetanaerobacterium sp.]
VHDIGIKASEEKYGSCAGNYQELEGPPLAKEMLTRLGFDPDVTERVCYLVGHHHTYSGINADDYRMLVEADLIVNIQEDDITAESAYAACGKYFRSKSAIAFLHRLFEPYP